MSSSFSLSSASCCSPFYIKDPRSVPPCRALGRGLANSPYPRIHNLQHLVSPKKACSCHWVQGEGSPLTACVHSQESLCSPGVRIMSKWPPRRLIGPFTERHYSPGRLRNLIQFNQIDMRQINKRNDQFYYICTYGDSIRIWDPRHTRLLSKRKKRQGPGTSKLKQAIHR